MPQELIVPLSKKDALDFLDKVRANRDGIENLAEQFVKDSSVHIYQNVILIRDFAEKHGKEAIDTYLLSLTGKASRADVDQYVAAARLAFLRKDENDKWSVPSQQVTKYAHAARSIIGLSHKEAMKELQEDSLQGAIEAGRKALIKMLGEDPPKEDVAEEDTNEKLRMYIGRKTIKDRFGAIAKIETNNGKSVIKLDERYFPKGHIVQAAVMMGEDGEPVIIPVSRKEDDKDVPVYMDALALQYAPKQREIALDNVLKTLIRNANSVVVDKSRRCVAISASGDEINITIYDRTAEGPIVVLKTLKKPEYIDEFELQFSPEQAEAVRSAIRSLNSAKWKLEVDGKSTVVSITKKGETGEQLLGYLKDEDPKVLPIEVLDDSLKIDLSVKPNTVPSIKPNLRFKQKVDVPAGQFDELLGKLSEQGFAGQSIKLIQQGSKFGWATPSFDEQKPTNTQEEILYETKQPIDGLQPKGTYARAFNTKQILNCMQQVKDEDGFDDIHIAIASQSIVLRGNGSTVLIPNLDIETGKANDENIEWI